MHPIHTVTQERCVRRGGTGGAGWGDEERGVLNNVDGAVSRKIVTCVMCECAMGTLGRVQWGMTG